MAQPKVNETSTEVNNMSVSWGVINALLGGTKAMRDAGETYLPKWEREDHGAYDKRLNNAVLYPAYSRTIEVLAAKPFSKATTYTDIPPEVEPLMENVDLQKRNFQAFMSEVMKPVMSHGISGVLVDWPEVGEFRNKEEEINSGVRPFLVHFPPGSVLGWKTNMGRLTQLRLLVYKSVDDGPFATKQVQQIRVLEPGRWARYERVDNDKNEWALIGEGKTTLQEIPFVPFYGVRTGYMTAKPPLEELAYLNVQHWQDSSDQRKAVSFARIRLGAIIGADELPDMTQGADYLLKLPTGGDIKIVQGSAESVNVGRQELKELEEQMRHTGAELLLLQPGKITATQFTGENDANKSALQRITENFEDSGNQVLQFMADWMKAKGGGKMNLFKDFSVTSLSDASAQLVFSMNQGGKLSDETAFNEMKRRSVISPDLDYEEEKEKLDLQGPPPGTLGVNDSEAA